MSFKRSYGSRLSCIFEEEEWLQILAAVKIVEEERTLRRTTKTKWAAVCEILPLSLISGMTPYQIELRFHALTCETRGRREARRSVGYVSPRVFREVREYLVSKAMRTPPRYPNRSSSSTWDREEDFTSPNVTERKGKIPPSQDGPDTTMSQTTSGHYARDRSETTQQLTEPRGARQGFVKGVQTRSRPPKVPKKGGEEPYANVSDEQLWDELGIWFGHLSEEIPGSPDKTWFRDRLIPTAKNAYRQKVSKRSCPGRLELSSLKYKITKILENRRSVDRVSAIIQLVRKFVRNN